MDVEPDMVRATKTFRKVPRYGTASGRVMVREAGLINWQRLERLIDADYGEALRILNETSYGPYLEGAEVASDLEDGFARYLADEYRFIDEVCKGTFVAEFLRCRYDFHNIKVVFKEQYFGGAAEAVVPGLGNLDVDAVRRSVEKREAGHLPAFWESVIAHMKSAMEAGERDPQFVDMTADRLYLEHRLDLAKADGSRPLVNFSRAEIDAANIRVLLRGKALGKGADYFKPAFAEGGRLGRNRLAALAGESSERIMADLEGSPYGRIIAGAAGADEKGERFISLDKAYGGFLLEKIGSAARVAVGPERIVRYMLSRESDIETLRIVLMGKLHGLGSADIARRLSPEHPNVQ